MEFAYAGGGLGKGGKVTLYTDGKPVGAGEIPMTLAMCSRPTTAATSAWIRALPYPRITARTATLSTARSRACRSRSPTPPRTRTISSRRRRPSASRWRGSRRLPDACVDQRHRNRAMTSEDRKHRSHLPMPNTTRTQFIAYDAKDPDSKFPPIEQLRPPKGAPNVLDRPDRRRRLRLVQRLRRPLPDAERGEAGGGRPEVQPLPHHRALLADAAGAADRTQSPLRRHGRHHRDRHRRAGLLLGAAQHDVAAGAHAEAQRLLHRAVRQVPRGAGLADQPGRPVRRLAHRRRRLRVLLRLHRRRGEPVVPDALRRHHAGRDRRRRPKRATTSSRT